MMDGMNTVARWMDKQGIRFVSVTQDFDFRGTVGKMVASLLFGLAEMEQATRRERQAAGIAVAKEKGMYTGRKAGAVKKGVKPARAKRLRKQGLTYAEIAEAMGISQSTVRRYLGVI
jgi:DNA invertase Pin-like site-specific DNA recombinase